MRDIKFVRSDYKGRSYDDFYKLVELSGFEITDHRSPNSLLVKIGFGCGYLSNIDKNVIYWYLERPSIEGGIENLRKKLRGFLDDKQAQEVWISDYGIWEELKDITKFVPIGSHEGLGYISDNKMYDYVDFCYMTNRRNILSRIKGIRAPHLYGSEKYDVVANAKYLVNIHQFEDSTAEHLRFALAAASGIPIISEACDNAYPYKDLPGFVECPYQDFISTFSKISNENYSAWAKKGSDMRKFILSNFNFRENVLKASKQ